MIPAGATRAAGYDARIVPRINLNSIPNSRRPTRSPDTVDGRYWMELEWRALAKALGSSGPARTAALRDALAFRTARRKVFPNAAENERLLEMNEGLAQYTGTVAAAASAAEATSDAIQQLSAAAGRVVHTDLRIPVGGRLRPAAG
jgi:hypothetical protein